MSIVTPFGKPRGSDTQFQFNNAGLFAGSSNLIYDSVNDRVGIGESTPTSLLSLGASTTSRAPFSISAGDAPSSPNLGDLWVTGTDLVFYDGTTAQSLIHSSAGYLLADGTVTGATSQAQVFTNGVTSTGVLTVGQLIRPDGDAVDAIKIQNAAGSQDILAIDTNNWRIGIGTNAPSSALHVLDGGGAITVSSSLANATNKTGRLVVQHYTNSEEGVVTISSSSTSSVNQVDFGGGSSIYNTATSLKFYSAANNTTLTGTEVARITTSGLRVNTAGVSSNATQALDVVGNIAYSGNLIGPIWRPASDSTTALRIQNAAGSAAVLTIDTTNSHIYANKGTSSTNLFLGAGGNSTTTSTNGMALGNSAGVAKTTGNFWTAIGNEAAKSNTTGTQWVALGYKAGQGNVGGSDWFACGYLAGELNSSGSAWFAMGSQAGKSNTSGSNWTAVGYLSSQKNQTGSNFVSVGFRAAETNTTATNYVAIGREAMFASTTNSGNNCVAVGYQAGKSNTTGSLWTAIGSQAGDSNITGSNWTAVGYLAGFQSTGSGGVFLGWQAGRGETASDRLHIATSQNKSLLLGDFANNLLMIGDSALTVPTAAADIAASTTARSSLRIRSGTAPTSPNDGDIWYGGTDFWFRSTASYSIGPTVRTTQIRPVSDSTTAIKFQNAAGSSDVITIDTTGSQVGINTTPSALLHMIGGFGEVRISDTDTDGGNKSGRFTCQHYTNAEEPLAGFIISSQSSSNNILFGGGSGIANTATYVGFYTASNNTTLVGSVRMSINSSGYVAFGTHSGTALADIAASTTDRSSLRIRSGTAPTSPNDGDIWNTGTQLFFRGTSNTWSIGSTVLTTQIRPVSDSTTAIRIQNAAGTTSVATVDTTNSLFFAKQLVADEGSPGGSTPWQSLTTKHTLTNLTAGDKRNIAVNFIVDLSSNHSSATAESIYVQTQTTGAFNANTVESLRFFSLHYGSGTVTQLTGIKAFARVDVAAGTASNAYGADISIDAKTNCTIGNARGVNIVSSNGSGSTITNLYQVYCNTPTTSGTIGTAYGLYVAAQSNASTNYAIYTNAGDIRLMSSSSDKIGFHGSTPVAKQTITGSRAGNAALADLLTKLATLGLITDSTSA